VSGVVDAFVEDLAAYKISHGFSKGTGLTLKQTILPTRTISTQLKFFPSFRQPVSGVIDAFVDDLAAYKISHVYSEGIVLTLKGALCA